MQEFKASPTPSRRVRALVGRRRQRLTSGHNGCTQRLRLKSHKSIQARPFAPVIDGDRTRSRRYARAVRRHARFPLAREMTFGLIAFEQRKRQEAGFFTSTFRRQTSSVTIARPSSPSRRPSTPSPQQAATPGLRAARRSSGRAPHHHIETGRPSPAAPPVRGRSPRRRATGSAAPAPCAARRRHHRGHDHRQRFFLTGAPSRHVNAFRPPLRLNRVFPSRRTRLLVGAPRPPHQREEQ